VARILLIHGAFGAASNWDPVLPGLRQAGRSVHALDLPGAGRDRMSVPEVTLSAYADRICRAAAERAPAVLVGHSMGGVAITQAAAQCPERVAALIYVAAFVPRDGQSLMNLTKLPEAAGDQVQANLVVDGDPPVATLPAAAARDALFACCDEEQAAWGIAQMGPQAVVPFVQPVRLAGPGSGVFAALPRSYVVCLQDQAIPPALQRLMLSAAGCHPVRELDTDHSPWISRTEELVAVIDELARATDAD
jgi:pimeloyl-ACP methyl ester carboxylesterase